MSNNKKLSFLKSIGGKLITISSLIVVTSIVVLTVIALIQMSGALQNEVNAKLKAIQQDKASLLNEYFDGVGDDADVIADTHDVKLAVKDFIRYHQEMNISATGNFDYTGSGEGLSMSYEEIYSEVDDSLKKYGEIYGYNDILIMCAAHGHVMYTNKRRSDLGTNLSTGKYSNSKLAEVWKKVATSREHFLVDLAKYEPAEGHPAMFIGAPIMNGTDIIAVLGLEINPDHISEVLTNTAGMGESGEVYATGDDKIMRSESRFSKKGETTILNRHIDTPASHVIDQNSTEVFTNIFPAEDGINVFSVYSHLRLDETMNADFDWALIAEIHESEVMAPVVSLGWLLAIIAIVLIAAVVVIMVLFSGTISRPIQAGVKAAEQISMGNLNFSINKSYLKRGDEIGQLSVSLQHMVTKLSEIVSAVLSGSEQIASASEELASGNQDLSNRTEQQATALEETSSAIEEMNASVKSNADNTGTADKLSRNAMEKSGEGSDAVSKMITSMKEISDSSNRIADIIEVINNIAFQTNLLALNASIEAARAGDQGKGFAVVAVEVRKLAKRSDKAAGEIAEIIKKSNKKVEDGVDIANTAGEMLAEINGAVKKVTALVAEISAASQEQLSSVDQIDKTLASLDENTQKNAALVEEAASSTEELAGQAQELNSNMQFFKLDTSVKIPKTSKKKETGVRLLKVSQQKTRNTAGSSGSGVDAYEKFTDMTDEGEFEEF